MIDTSKPIPNGEFWSYDWGQVWHAKAVLTSAKNVAYCDDGQIKVVVVQRCFLTAREAWMELARLALIESQNNMEALRKYSEAAAKSVALEEGPTT